MSYNVFPALKTEYANSGVSVDIHAIAKVLASISRVPVSAEPDGVCVSIDLGTWRSMKQDMLRLQASFPLLVFSVQRLVDDVEWVTCDL